MSNPAIVVCHSRSERPRPHTSFSHNNHPPGVEFLEPHPPMSARSGTPSRTAEAIDWRGKIIPETERTKCVPFIYCLPALESMHSLLCVLLFTVVLFYDLLFYSKLPSTLKFFRSNSSTFTRTK